MEIIVYRCNGFACWQVKLINDVAQRGRMIIINANEITQPSFTYPGEFIKTLEEFNIRKKMNCDVTLIPAIVLHSQFALDY